MYKILNKENYVKQLKLKEYKIISIKIIKLNKFINKIVKIMQRKILCFKTLIKEI